MCQIILVRDAIFKRFLCQNLHPAGGLELQSIKQLGRLARGEDRLSPYYAMVADAIIGLGSILYQAVL